MSLNHWYPHYTGDYNNKTAHLSLIEHGAYRVLLDYYYSTASPIPDDKQQLYRICRAFAEQERDAIDRVLQLFFKHDAKASVFINERCDEEIEKKESISHKRAQAAKSKGKKPSANAKQMQSKCKAIVDTSTSTSTSTSTLTSTSNPPKAPKKQTALETSFPMPGGEVLSFDEMFERFWLLYPSTRSKGSKAQARAQFLTKLNKGESYESIGRGIAKYRKYCESTGEKQKDMFRWIRDGGWENDYTIPVDKPRSSSGYSIDSALGQAMDDRTKNPEGRTERLAALGINQD